MAIEIKHAYTATGTDAENAEVGKTEWNAALSTSMATARLLGRTTAGAGAFEEISVGSGLTLSSGTLSASAAGGAVRLGTMTTTSGSSASLGSLDLTDYKVVELWLLGVSQSTGSGFAFRVGNSASDDVAVSSNTVAADLLVGVVKIDLNDGRGVSMLSSGASNFQTHFDTALSTSTTTIYVEMSGATLDAGSIIVMGYK
jgi:hypothetical protein